MAFSYYRTITIDKTKVPNTDRTDFPVLVSGTYTYLKTTGNGGNVQNANGYDVGFYSNSSLTTKLKWETEKYTATTGEVVYWVKVPTVSTSTDTVIYMAYGDSSISTDQSDPTNVWDSNYKSVYHLKDGTTLSMTESTANALNGTNNGATATSGKINGAAAFSNQYITGGTASSAIDITSNITVSAWINPASLPGANSYRDIVQKGYDGTNEQYALTLQSDSNTTGNQALNFSTYNGSAHSAFWVHGSSITTGNWYYVVGVFNGTSWFVYSDGVQRGSSTDSTGPAHSAKGLNIGAADLGAYSRYFDGSIDEVRISNTARSADWIATEYNNQNSPSTFYTVGSETPAGGTTVNSGFFQFM